jgi:glycosyltransferase involved in cell wall biosynthesis
VKVGVDVSPLAQTRAGTARYIEGLLAELERRPDVEIRRLGFGGAGKAAGAARDTLWYFALLPWQARGLDILHCTTFRAPLRSPAPLVVTVHDLALLRHPELFTRWMRLYGAVALRKILRRADRLLAVSDFTKREVVELVGVSEERVRVVPNSTGPSFRPDGPTAEGDYVLAVGTLEPRKNLGRLADATRRLGLELRIVGARGWGDVDLSANGIRWLGELPDEDVAALYRGALCFAYPSLYEGFGIPVLEAMRCGVPVVTSAGTVMEELTGDAAELVDPFDAGSIAAGIERAIERRADLAARGLERARGYTWAAAAEATVAVYRELAQ